MTRCRAEVRGRPPRGAPAAGSSTGTPRTPAAWAAGGARVARRNLVWSILVEHVGFSVWLLWSAVVVYLPAAGFAFAVDQLFWLVGAAEPGRRHDAVPLHVRGGAVRRPELDRGERAAAARAADPARRWCVTTPGTPYPMFLVAAATAGLGGGNFASSMANISHFYPDARKGVALGVNAAGGNIGVSTVQLVVPAVVGLALVSTGSTGVHLVNVVLVWGPATLLVALGAWLCMDNLRGARSPLAEQLRAARRPHTWVMALLYVGTFGSFIGFGAALPLLMKTQFPDVHGVYYAFLGALVGSAFRPMGGWLADRFGGARITAAVFVAMGLFVLGVVAALQAASFAAFLACFIVLFALTGLGNGSTYRMIPAIYRAQVPDEATARRQGAAALGLVAAVGAYGGFLVPRALGLSVAHTGGIAAALYGFVAFYALCTAVTWWCYLRRRVLVARTPSLVGV